MGVENTRRLFKAITLALLVVAALTGCALGSGPSRAESTVHDAFDQTSDLGTLESVSCEDSKTEAPPREFKITLYDCQVTTTEKGQVTWCLIDTPGGMGPVPLSCDEALAESY